MGVVGDTNGELQHFDIAFPLDCLGLGDACLGNWSRFVGFP